MTEKEEQKEDQVRCGYVAVVGRPNVGKSTLLNRLLGQQVAIVTPKPQTTRNRILAVYNDEDAQIIFLDTPGIHQPQGSLGRYMNDAAGSAIADADVCVWLIDMGWPKRPEGLSTEELEVADQLAKAGRPIIVLPNKVDLVKDKKALLPLSAAAAELPKVKEVIPISALKGDGADILLTELKRHLPMAPRLYPADMLSDQAERFFVAEMVREALTDLTRQEIPYHSAVVIDRFVEETDRCMIHAAIHVERKSQRGIVVGRGGQMIKEIGRRAREAAEKFLGCPVDLKLHVNVTPGWTKNTRGLKKMGYE